MKCYIVKDLLPLYAEQLTNEQTAAEIQAHLEQCADCAQTYAQMQESSAPPIALPDDVKPLKAVRKRGRRNSLIIAAAAAVLVLIFYMLIFKFCIAGVQLCSDQIQMEITAYWEIYDENKRLGSRISSFDTYEEAAAAMKEADGETLYEKIEIVMNCDCFSLRTEAENAFYTNDADIPLRYRSHISDFALYSVMLPPLEPTIRHKSLWSKTSYSNTVTAGSAVIFRCKDGTFAYDLTELAALADSSPDGKAMLTVGEKLPKAE